MPLTKIYSNIAAFSVFYVNPSLHSGQAERNGTLTPQLVAEGLAARYCLMINLIFALLGLLFCLFLVMNYRKWFGQSAMAAKNPGETY